jgi:3-oxoacyl-[acyl-carrier-protein] synthase II
MRRVVVTGMGMVSPLGLNVPESWGNLLAGKSGVVRV